MSYNQSIIIYNFIFNEMIYRVFIWLVSLEISINMIN